MSIVLSIISVLGFLTAARAHEIMVYAQSDIVSWLYLFSSGTFFVAMGMGVMCALLAILVHREDHWKDT